MVDSAVIFGCFRHIWWKFNGGFWRTGVMGLIQDFLKMEKITRLPLCHEERDKNKQENTFNFNMYSFV